MIGMPNLFPYWLTNQLEKDTYTNRRHARLNKFDRGIILPPLSIILDLICCRIEIKATDSKDVKMPESTPAIPAIASHLQYLGLLLIVNQVCNFSFDLEMSNSPR